MRFLYCTSLYPDYVRHVYGANPLLALESYASQLNLLDEDAFAWVGAWKDALAPFGYEVQEILLNVPLLQNTWAWENDRNLLSPEDLARIAVEQARRLRPEVVFFDSHDALLLKAIKDAVPELQLVIGWVGGTTPADAEPLREFDIVLSCAPESVAWLRERGFVSHHLHHGFNARVLGRLAPRDKSRGAAFYGQIVTRDAFHGEREKFFERLIEAGLEVEIHSPTRGVGRKLKPWLRPGVYGLDMYQAISETKVALNAHADASVRYASNMRLFEVAGAGTCLLTDWRENLAELFEPDTEIATYRSAEECVEKLRWLLDHPVQCAAIGKAAQARALRDHSYARRASRLDEIIQSARGRGARA